LASPSLAENARASRRNELAAVANMRQSRDARLTLRKPQKKSMKSIKDIKKITNEIKHKIKLTK